MRLTIALAFVLALVSIALGACETQPLDERPPNGAGGSGTAVAPPLAPAYVATMAAFDNGLIPMVCVGETLAERESNRTLEVVERQVERALRPLKPEEVARMVVSYEPVWAIGTGRVATPDQAEEVQAFLRKRIAISHGDDAAQAVRILYGGSVNPGNTPGIMIQADVDGVLVGGASLKAETFLGIVNYREEAKG